MAISAYTSTMFLEVTTKQIKDVAKGQNNTKILL
jgi:hypothetical protein